MTRASDDFPIELSELARRKRAEEAPFGASIDELRALLAWCARQPGTVEERFPDLARFLVFVGYPRSGHSILGALIDAHPEAAVAHELHVTRLMRLGMKRRALFILIAECSRRMAAVGRGWGAYDYAVASGFQGRWDRLRVIGDKRGAGTSKQLMREPGVLRDLAAHVRLPVRVLHVVRDPRRHLPSMARHYLRTAPERRLDLALAHYADLSAGAARAVEEAGPEGAMTVWHEDLLDDPRAILDGVARFLGLADDAGWREACAAIVRPQPARAADLQDWTPAQQEAVDRLIEAIPFLHRYRR